MANKPQVDLFFSFRSPYSYLAIGRLAEWAKSDNVEINLLPVLPLAIRTPDFFQRIDPLLPSYIKTDLIRVAEFHKIPFRWAQPDPVIITLDPLCIPEEQPYIHRLTRLGAEAARRGNGLGFAVHVSRLIWGGEVEDWTEGDHLRQAVAGAGLDLDELDEIIEVDALALDDFVSQNQRKHRASGHWGVPCMVYNGEPFFGQDRIEILKWRVAQSRKNSKL